MHFTEGMLAVCTINLIDPMHWTDLTDESSWKVQLIDRGNSKISFRPSVHCCEASVIDIATFFTCLTSLSHGTLPTSISNTFQNSQQNVSIWVLLQVFLLPCPRHSYAADEKDSVDWTQVPISKNKSESVVLSAVIVEAPTTIHHQCSSGGQFMVTRELCITYSIDRK